MTNEWLEARNQDELDALLAKHGQALRVRVVGTWKGDLSISRRALHSIDLAGVHVRGSVDAAGARLEGELHACEAQIDGNLDISVAQIAGDVRADEARIEGDVDATGAHIGGDVSLRDADMDHLILDDAHIEGDVDATCAHLDRAMLYRDAQIGGDIEMPSTMHGHPGRAIAQCDGYILWVNDEGQVRAGCRGPFTFEEALAHWGEHRKDERARVFREAIEETIIEFDRIYSSW
jgi:cytoskeletal protein CcmA (bactofilin family)